MNGYGQQTGFNPQLMQAIAQQEEMRHKQDMLNQAMQSQNGWGGGIGALGQAIAGFMSGRNNKKMAQGEADIQSQIQEFQAQQAQAMEEKKRAAQDKAYNDKYQSAFELVKDPAKARAVALGMSKLTDFQEKKTELERNLSNPEVKAYMEQRDKNKGVKITNNLGGKPATEMQKKMGAKYADKYEKWEGEAIAGNEMLGMLQQMQKIDQLQKTGKVQEAGALIGQWFGAEAGANMQTYNSLQKKMMLEAANKLSGAMSEGEWAILGQLMPSFANDPRANAQINKILSEAAERSISRFNSSADYFDKNQTLQGYRPPFEFSGRKKAEQKTQEPVKEINGKQYINKNGKWFEL
jgi:hypothetical protein